MIVEFAVLEQPLFGEVVLGLVVAALGHAVDVLGVPAVEGEGPDEGDGHSVLAVLASTV